MVDNLRYQDISDGEIAIPYDESIEKRIYEEQNALELIAMNPRRNIFCIVTGGSIRYTFPGLLDMLKAKPL